MTIEGGAGYRFGAMSPELWLYASIPVISAIVGWGTNVVALKMTFYPLDFIGKPPYLGWQGIIPAKAAKMADKAVDLMTTKLITPEEVFTRLDPARVVREMEPAIHRLLDDIVNEVMLEESPTMWELLPNRVKAEIIDRAKDDAGQAITQMMIDVRGNIKEVFDLKAMVIDALIRDKRLLNEIFLRAGEAEFRFIEQSGLYFGFLFGVIQMTLWIFYKGWWVLPAAGFAVGYATNWLALQMIFRPVKPRKIGPFVIQGMFLKRQAEVADKYADLISAEILSSRNIINAIIRGPLSDKLFTIIQRHVRQGVDLFTGVSKPLVQLALGTRGYLRVKDRVGEKIMQHAPEPLQHVERYADEAMDIENTLRTKLQELSPEEFEGLLRPVFQEDEWKLILVGGVLGVIVGFGQLLFMF